MAVVSGHLHDAYPIMKWLWNASVRQYIDRSVIRLRGGQELTVSHRLAMLRPSGGGGGVQ